MFSRLLDALNTPAPENWLLMSNELFAAPMPPVCAISEMLLPMTSAAGLAGSPLLSYFDDAASTIEIAARNETSPVVDWIWSTFRLPVVSEIQMLPFESAVTVVEASTSR